MTLTLSKHVQLANPSAFTSLITQKGDILMGSGDNAVGLLDAADGSGQMLTADARGNVGGEWRLPTNMQPPAVGDYFTTPHVSRSAGSAATNVVNLIPIWIPSRLTLDRIGCEVTTLDASAVIRLGIYNHSFTTQRPDGLVFDAGTVSGGAAAVVETTINQTLDAGLYYLAAAVQGTVSTLQVRRIASIAYCLPGASGTAYGATVPVIYSQSSISGALPVNATPSATSSNSAILVFLRRSA